MISSAIPSAKYSFSASLLMFANGSTATDFADDTACCGNVVVSVGVDMLPDARACANCAAVLNRAAMSTAIALERAFASGSGTLLRTLLTDGTVSVNRLVMTACGVGPVNGLSPVSYTHLRAHETPEHLV